MSVAAPFWLNYDLNDSINEFNIEYYKDNNTIEKLLDFSEEYPDKLINVKFIGDADFTVVKTIARCTDNVKFRINALQLHNLAKFKECGAKFFFDADLDCYNYSTLNSVIQLGTTDIYITDDLIYDLDNVKKICDNNNVRLRLILNRIPSTSVDKGLEYSTPFYRPNDIDKLRQWFDVFEFDVDNRKGRDLFKTLYKIWFIKKDWYDNLREINLDLNFDVPNKSLIPDFSNYKFNCRKRCVSKPVQYCKKCQQFLEIAGIIRNNNFIIKEVGNNE